MKYVEVTISVKDLIISIFLFVLLSSTVYFIYENFRINKVIDDLEKRTEELLLSLEAEKSEVKNLYEYVNTLNSIIDSQKSKIENMENDISYLKSEINKRISLNPTYEELVNFVKEDNTNELKYISEGYRFVCTDFANTFIKHFRERGYYSCEVDLYLVESGEEIGHTIVAVNTSDRGVVYIEPQNDKIIFSLNVGDNYCEKVGWNCYARIIKISDCFNVQ